jgi:hypothetical protein
MGDDSSYVDIASEDESLDDDSVLTVDRDESHTSNGRVEKACLETGEVLPTFASMTTEAARTAHQGLDNTRNNLSVAAALAWNKQYEKLVAFKQKNGHCIVPQRYQADMSLGKWVDTQRQMHANNTIRPGRKDLLDQLDGFVWGVDKVARWNKQYAKLVAFKQKNGHCLVLKRYQEDASLGMWVHTQRKYHKTKKLLRDRRKLLDKIDFVWKADTLAAARSSTTHVSCRH